MTDFVLGIMTSLVASGVIFVASLFWSKRVRRFITVVQGWLLHIDVEYVFRNSGDAASDIQSEIERATRVDLFTGRGNELQRNTFKSLLGARPSSGEKPFRILLPDPTVDPQTCDWTAQREEEVAKFDRSFGTGIIPKQIETNVRFLDPHVKANAVELRFYNSPHIGRIIVTDRAAYFTPYRAGAHGRDCRVFKFRAGGDMYDFFVRFFDLTWETSRVLENHAKN